MPKLLFYLIVTIVLAFSASAGASTLSTIGSGKWSSPTVWSSGAIPQNGDSVIITVGDTLSLDTSTAVIASIAVNGIFQFGSDILFLQSPANSGDTLIQVRGTLDAGSGWFSIAGSARPTVHLFPGSLFRTAADFPFISPSIFDSIKSPFFVCDSASTFEYYSTTLDLIDVSYLANNLIGHSYANLTLTLMNASFRANYFGVRGSLHIGYGATVNPAAGRGGTQQITILGDVIDSNLGPSGGQGAGLRGCGMLSAASDTWIFGDSTKKTGKDTCHWSGPSQVGTVIIRQNTALSVRFIADTLCDSLDILGQLVEENKPCGGHLIGRVFSEFPQTLSATNPIDSFDGFGLTIKSGTDPYLGTTRVVRTSGYAPPGTNPPSPQQIAMGATNPVLRYYSITTGDGPQQGDTNVMTFQAHCDELNGNDPAKLNFWRSRDQGKSWAFSGLTSYDAQQDIFVWDTIALCWPNDSGSFLWMLSPGYTDSPTPVELGSFNVRRSGNDMLLSWQTTSAINIAGYEIRRSAGENNSEIIATFATDNSLRSHSNYGSSYSYYDLLSDSGSIRYDLYEVSNDGISEWLASQTAAISNSRSNSPMEISYSNGSLSLTTNSPLDLKITVADELGRARFATNITSPNGYFSTPLELQPGFYFATCRWNGREVTKRILVVPN